MDFVTLVQALAGPAGAAAAGLLFAYLFLSGKVHSDKEFQRLLRENEDLKGALETERKAATEAARTADVTNRLIGALVDVSHDERGTKPSARKQPLELETRDAEM